MRHLTRIAPVLLGLILGAPLVAPAQTADCPDCDKGYVSPGVGPTKFRGPKLCEDCYKKYKKTGVWPGAVAPNLPGWAPQGQMPAGYASTGQPAAGNSPYGPGYAVAGASVVSDEPMPIGVMRTNYRPGPAAAAMPGPMAAPAPGMMPYAAPMPHDEAPFAGAKPARRHSVLRTMLGLNGFNRWSAEREAQAKAAHAREAYGQSGYATSVPAGMIYGR